MSPKYKFTIFYMIPHVDKDKDNSNDVVIDVEKYSFDA